MSKLLFFGDSITAGAWDAEGGWCARIIKEIMAYNIKSTLEGGEFHCVPHNLGISGNMSADILARLEPEAQARRYRDDPQEPLHLICHRN